MTTNTNQEILDNMADEFKAASEEGLFSWMSQTQEEAKKEHDEWDKKYGLKASMQSKKDEEPANEEPAKQRLKLSDYVNETVYTSTRMFPAGFEECIHCGRPVNPDKGWAVHLSHDWELIHKDDETEEDTMGWQFIGTTCAKRIPRGYKSK